MKFSRFAALTFFALLICSSCYRQIKDELGSRDIIDGTPVFACGFYDTIQNSNYPVQPSFTGNIAPNTIKICRWNGKTVVPYWITPVFLPRKHPQRIWVSVVNSEGYIIKVIDLDANLYHAADLNVHNIILRETTKGELVCELNGEYYRVGHNTTIPSSEKLLFYKANDGMSAYFPTMELEIYHTTPFGYYLAGYEDDIADLHMICEERVGESHTLSKHSGYQVDFKGIPLRKYDFITSQHGDLFRVYGQEIDTLYAYQMSPPRGTDADFPELHSHIRTMLYNRADELLSKYSRGEHPDDTYQYESSKKTFEDSQQLRDVATLTKIWKTIKWMGYDTFLDVEDFNKGKFRIVDGVYLDDYYKGEYSYHDLLNRLIQTYNAPTDTIIYFNEFWNRRRVEGNAPIVFEIMQDVVNFYEDDEAEDILESEVNGYSETLAKCIEFEFKLKNNPELKVETLNAYVDYLNSIGMYASAAVIVREASFYPDSTPAELIEKTTGPNFQTRIDWNRVLPWTTTQWTLYDFVACDRGP